MLPTTQGHMGWYAAAGTEGGSLYSDKRMGDPGFLWEEMICLVE